MTSSMGSSKENVTSCCLNSRAQKDILLNLCMYKSTLRMRWKFSEENSEDSWFLLSTKRRKQETNLSFVSLGYVPCSLNPTSYASSNLFPGGGKRERESPDALQTLVSHC